MVGIDGLPIGSRRSQFWPILGKINLSPQVFIIGCYYGNEKPSDITSYLRHFVDDVLEIQKYGISISDNNFNVVLQGLILDVPAKAAILGIKGHTGYSSCTKCTVEGKYIGNRVCFFQFNNVKRTNESVINGMDKKYNARTAF